MTSTNQIQIPLTDQDIEDLARQLHRIRDGWHTASLTTLLHKLAGEYDGATLRRAAIAAAKDKTIRTPAGIEWTARDLAAPAAERDGRDPCATCGKPRHACLWDRPRVARPEDVDDHLYLTQAEAEAQAAARKREAVS